MLQLVQSRHSCCNLSAIIQTFDTSGSDKLSLKSVKMTLLISKQWKFELSGEIEIVLGLFNLESRHQSYRMRKLFLLRSWIGSKALRTHKDDESICNDTVAQACLEIVLQILVKMSSKLFTHRRRFTTSSQPSVTWVRKQFSVANTQNGRQHTFTTVWRTARLHMRDVARWRWRWIVRCCIRWTTRTFIGHGMEHSTCSTESATSTIPKTSTKLSFRSTGSNVNPRGNDEQSSRCLCTNCKQILFMPISPISTVKDAALKKVED